MCYCEKPTRNDEPKSGFSVGEFPPMENGQSIIMDEPGRCIWVHGGKTYPVDYHSHHFRLIGDTQQPFSVLWVRHGGGLNRVGLVWRQMLNALLSLSSDERYLVLHSIYDIAHDAKSQGSKETATEYQKAILEKRVKIRRRKKQAFVEILPRIVNVEEAAK